jgi:hypothetical protein
MTRLFVLIFLNLQCFALSAIDYSGIYAFSKGLNKPNGSLCVFHIKSDTVFYYLSNMTGAPDFNLTNMKGFLKVDSSNASYKKDSCGILLNFKPAVISVSQSKGCKSDFMVEGDYKKSGNSLKRPNTWMTEYTEKGGVILVDSSVVYFAPHVEAKALFSLKKETAIKILDEVNGFYLIESPKQKNEFHWTLKKNVLLNKK